MVTLHLLSLIQKIVFSQKVESESKNKELEVRALSSKNGRILILL